MEEIRFEHDCDTAAPHFHDELEMIYVLSGRVGVMLEQSNYLLGQEDFTVFNPFEHHDLYREAGSHTLSAYIPLDILLQCGLGEVSCCSAIQQERGEVLHLLRAKLADIYKNFREGETAGSLHILSGIYGLLALIKQYFEVSSSSSGEPEPVYSANRMRHVLLYIQEHYTENLSLQEVAEKNYLSAGHLSRQFEKQMGMHFSEYLRSLRLRTAARLIRSTNKSILEISEECGFSNVNTLTVNFKAFYGETPSKYRKQYSRAEAVSGGEQYGSANDIRLLKYAQDEVYSAAFPHKNIPVTVIRANLRTGRTEDLKLRHNTAISSGYAKDYFVEGHQELLSQAVREIGYRYLFVQGVLDDSVNIYHEHLDGTPWLNYTYLDTIVDHICSTGALPWLELSHTPEKLLAQKTMIFNDGYIQLPDDLSKWELLIDRVLEHLILRYGAEQVRRWRFSLFPALYLSYGLFSVEDYLEYHLRTWNAIRRRLSDVTIVGGAFDSGYLMLDGEEPLKRYLQYCRENHCMPDEIGLQSFGVDYAALPRKEIESRILEQVTGNRQEPAPPNRDPDFIRRGVEAVLRVLEENQAGSLPVCLIYWDSTVWSYDLGNDTCYKAAFLAKNCLEMAGMAASLNNSLFVDRPWNLDDVPGPFCGGRGSINYMGIPKAAYRALCLLSELEPQVLAKGEGYVVTCSEDRKRIRILLYHYCHYNPDTHTNQVLPWEEQLTVDRYGRFSDPGQRNFQLCLKGLGNGNYEEERFVVSRKSGSSYDIWQDMGAPRTLTARQRDYLIQVSKPGYHYGALQIIAGEEILLSAALGAHEVHLLCLTKQDET